MFSCVILVWWENWSKVQNYSQSSLWGRDFSEKFQPIWLKLLWKISSPQWWLAVISNPVENGDTSDTRKEFLNAFLAKFQTRGFFGLSNPSENSFDYWYISTSPVADEVSLSTFCRDNTNVKLSHPLS